MRRGDHIKVNRGIYSHHGILVGANEVIHYTGELASKENAVVRLDPLDRFLSGGTPELVQYGRCLSDDEVVCRARSRMGENLYDLFENNCEHFARWCKTGERQSEQVRNAASSTAGTVGVGAAAAGSVGVVSATGVVAGLSGAGIMSGLGAVGGAVGAGAIGGLGVLAAAPIAVTSIAMNQVLRDDPSLPEDEREARKTGRTATVIGGVTGVGGSVAAISVAGTVSGLSAAGITSGLAAIGGTVGGGMVAGVAVTVAAPAAAAAAIGYGAYRFIKWLKD
ncbi:lecithin retinol acyltransferase family protein [Myxococcus sp. XM-1-1-1]|uniref:lecithin retinol acyltransferase family protein n=1 Tax=Myxococcus sp. XM-1-1-1 TaxID=2874602 RepID=UPI001CBB0673|nr:lecithin retinol acyltransferase family protein [Myxococcus sp. XM-1-1-1]MBZ4414682.1 lecithin retinol acyltransferase family protein [Myxococcus sp. XM-1-1-1]